MLRECPIDAGLRLRQLEEADLPALVECLNDEEVARNTRTIPFPYTWQDAQGFWQKRQELDRENGGIPTYWVIERREHGLVGGISVSLMGGLNGHRDEIGYVIGAAWRGRGYATAAVQALTAMQFETRPQLMRLEAWVYAHNPASKRVLEKAGYTVEGYCHSIFLKDNQLLDAWLLARLRSASSL